MLGLEHDGEPDGRILAGALPGLIQSAMRSLATGQTAAAATPGRLDRGPNGAQLVDLGISEERLVGAQQRLMQLFAYAAERGFDIHYG